MSDNRSPACWRRSAWLVGITFGAGLVILLMTWVGVIEPGIGSIIPIGSSKLVLLLLE